MKKELYYYSTLRVMINNCIFKYVLAYIGHKYWIKNLPFDF